MDLFQKSVRFWILNRIYGVSTYEYERKERNTDEEITKFGIMCAIVGRLLWGEYLCAGSNLSKSITCIYYNG